jgi:hypothetical protein
MKINKDQQQFFYLLAIYIFLFFIYSLFSFVFTDPNLTLVNNIYFTRWQNFLWQNILPNVFLRTATYLFLIITLFINYYYLLKKWPKKISFFDKKFGFSLLMLFGIILLSYNALSHDLFNYIFNARILVKYGANPHLTPALNFAHDPWSRFMHNTHTTAPYGQLWTLLSLAPYYLGFNKFILTWLSFKFFSFLAMLIAFFCSWKLLDKNKNRNFQLALLFLNPLILIETLSNAHNDWWMMWPVLLSFLIAKKFKEEKEKKIWQLLIIVLLMFFSIFTKFASLLVLPFLLYYLIKDDLNKLIIFQNNSLKKLKKFIDQYFWDITSFTLFIPLLTARSQRFLTWYLIWSIAFLPLLKSKWWKNNLLIFSVTALLSYLPWIIYLPWLTFDQETPNLLFLKQALLWCPILVYNLFLIATIFLKKCKK